MRSENRLFKVWQDIKGELRAIWYVMLSDFRVQILFAFGFVLNIVNILMGIGAYYFLTLGAVGGAVDVVKQYSPNVISYIVVGQAFNALITVASLNIYDAVYIAYMQREFQIFLISRVSLFTMLFAKRIGGLVFGICQCFLYLIVGVFFFHLSVDEVYLFRAVAVIVLGLVAVTGFGMVLTAVFFYTISAKSGGMSPVRVAQDMLLYFFTGVVFPVEVLPQPLQFISNILPQTHSLRMIRLTLSGHSWLDPSIVFSALYLLAFSVVTIPIGAIIIRRGLDRIRHEGYVPRVGKAIIWT